MADYVAAQASVLMVPTLGKGANSFQSKLKAELKKVRAQVDVQVNADTTAMLAQIKAAKEAAERDPINLKVNARQATVGLNAVKRNLNDLKDQARRGLVVNLTVAGMSQLTQLGLALASLNTSVVQLGQSMLVLPGIVGGLASSVTTAVVGTRGLTDAFQAQSKASKNVADSARQQTMANRAVRDSTRDLSNAIRDAKRQLEDLNAQLRDAPLDEAEAMLNLQEAIAEAADKAGKTAFEQQRDQLSVAKAESQLAETRRRNLRLQQDVQEANAKGVQGNDAVVAATERLTQALEDAARGTDAVLDLADAMGNLSPNAQDFVNKVRALGGAWGELRMAVQDRLFANLGDDIQALAGKGLPTLQEGLTGIAGAINGNLRQAFTSLGSDNNLSLLERLFGNTEQAQTLFSRALDPLISGVLRLTAAGSDSLPRLSDAFASVMNRFNNFVTAADNDGRLDKWIDAGLNALTDLGNSLINIGSILNSVHEAFTGTGGRGLLEVLADGTKRLADFLKGAEGQEKLRGYFYAAREEFQKWKPTLEQIPGIIKNVMAAGQAWADMLLPFLNTAGTLLKEHPALVATLLYAYLSWRTIQPVITGINTALSGMRTALDWVSRGLGDGNSGANGKLSRFASFIGVGGPIATGVAVVAGLLLNEYATAQNEAAQETEYHANMVNQLRSEIDDLTGSLTTGGAIRQLQRLSNWQNFNLTGDPSFNIPEIADNLGINRAKYQQALNPTQQAARNEVEGDLKKILREELLKPGNMYSENTEGFREALDKAKISIDDLVEALGGTDQSAVKKYEEAFGFGGPGWVSMKNSGTLIRKPPTLSDVLQGYDTKLPFDLGDLPALSPRGLDAANALRVLHDESSTALRVGEDTRRNNEAVLGKAEVRPDSPLAGLGSPRAFWNSNGDGGATVEVDASQVPPELIEAVGGEHNIERLPDRRTQIKLPKEVAEKYLYRRAGGGFMSGPGTGRSDSILAMLSTGEFVTRADSVAKYGRDFFYALNEGKIDPAALPRFSGGTQPGLDDLLLPGGEGFTPRTPMPATSPLGGLGPAPTSSGGGSILLPGADGFYPRTPMGPVSPLGGLSGPKPAPKPAPKPVPKPAKASVSGVPVASPSSSSAPVSVGDVHGLGASPGPGNGVPHAGSGAAPGPATETAASTGLFGALGISDNPDGPKHLQEDNVTKFLGNLAQDVGSQLLSIGVKFLAGITGIDLSSVLGWGQSIAGHYLGDKDQKDGKSKPKDADPDVAKILADYEALNVASQYGFVGTLTGEVPDVPGGEGLKPNAAKLRNILFAKYPMLQTIGGFRQDSLPEHPSGRALDIMIPNWNSPEGIALGNQILGDVMSHPDFYGAIWRGMSYGYGSGGAKPYTRGGNDPTQGHYDHVHVWLKEAQKFALGGPVVGPGTSTSDSILAQLSNGEYVVNANAVNQVGTGFLDAVNAGQVDPNAAQSQQPTDTAMRAAGEAINGIGGVLGGTGAGPGGPIPGAKAPSGATAEQDPRSILGAAPTNLDHNNPALSKGISGAASTIGSLIASAASAAGGAAGAAGAPGAGQGAALAASAVQGGAQIAGQVANGAVNILSSLLVGTLSGGTTQNAYGAPVLPQGPPQSGGGGPAVVNNYGDIHTASYDEFYRGQQRREAQQQAPILPMR
ncbi:tape measure protein [Mycobacterium phage Tyson]|nr:tape measure protein [Mycobacterium phage Tyson]